MTNFALARVSALMWLDDQRKITNSSAERDPDLAPFSLLFVLEAALHDFVLENVHRFTSDQVLAKHISYLLIDSMNNERLESKAVIVHDILIYLDKCGFMFPN
jgi:flagellar basal body-associated protein FliL